MGCAVGRAAEIANGDANSNAIANSENFFIGVLQKEFRNRIESKRISRVF